MSSWGERPSERSDDSVAHLPIISPTVSLIPLMPAMLGITSPQNALSTPFFALSRIVHEFSSKNWSILPCTPCGPASLPG